MFCNKILIGMLIIGFCGTVNAQDTVPKTTPVVDQQQQRSGNAGNSGQGSESTNESTEQDEGSTIEKASFLIGFNTITRLKQQNADFDFEQLLAGLNAANDGRESGMSREEQRSVLGGYQNLIRARIKAQRDEKAAANKAEGDAAIAEFAKQEGAKELGDGVMYVVTKEGDGELPEAPDRVKVHYKGTYTNGEVFDSSIEKGEPIVNGVMQFVPGFSKALQSMKVGSKWKLIVRGDQAYGMRPRSPMEVNKTLIFEVELLEIMDVE